VFNIYISKRFDISEQVSSTDSSYVSYELNIVLKTGERINLIDHGDIVSIRKNAKEIVQFTNRVMPIWDATLPENTMTDISRVAKINTPY
jgi:hypothetical protein